MADRPDVTTTIRRDRPTRSVAARRMNSSQRPIRQMSRIGRKVTEAAGEE
jgi:hypothetical protein